MVKIPISYFLPTDKNVNMSKLTLSHTNFWFLRVCSTSLLKTLWEKEKLLVISNFSFSPSFFNPFGELSAIFIFTPKILILTHQQQTVFENIVGKGEVTHNEQFLLFPRSFLLNQITVSQFVHTFDIISLFAAEFEKPNWHVM